MKTRRINAAVPWISYVVLAVAVVHSLEQAENVSNVNYRTESVGDVEFLDCETGHFALEPHGHEIAALVRGFLHRKVRSTSPAAHKVSLFVRPYTYGRAFFHKP